MLGDGNGGGVDVGDPVVVGDAQTNGEGPHRCCVERGRPAGGVVVLAVAIEVPPVEDDRAVGIGRAGAVERDCVADFARVGPARLGRGGDVGRGDNDGGRVGVLRPVVVGDAEADGERSHGGRRIGGRRASCVVVLAVIVEVPLVEDNRAVGIGRAGAVERDCAADFTQIGPTRLGRRRDVGRGDGNGGRVGVLRPVVVRNAETDGEDAHGGGRVVGRGAGGVVVLPVVVQVPLVEDDRAIRVGRAGSVECDRVASYA